MNIEIPPELQEPGEYRVTVGLQGIRTVKKVNRGTPDKSWVNGGAIMISLSRLTPEMAAHIKVQKPTQAAYLSRLIDEYGAAPRALRQMPSEKEKIVKVVRLSRLTPTGRMALAEHVGYAGAATLLMDLVWDDMCRGEEVEERVDIEGLLWGTNE